MVAIGLSEAKEGGREGGDSRGKRVRGRGEEGDDCEKNAAIRGRREWREGGDGRREKREGR